MKASGFSTLLARIDAAEYGICLRLNSGAALYVMDQVPNLRDGVELARETLRTGKALATLDALVAVSHSVSQGLD